MVAKFEKWWKANKHLGVSKEDAFVIWVAAFIKGKEDGVQS